MSEQVQYDDGSWSREMVPALTLTDFLLARIAEDEAVSLACARGWVGPESMGAIEGSDTVMVSPKRVYVECEAKRQRVAILAEMEAADENGVSSYAYSLLCREALPYADHESYDESWRP